jgi:hypothetical protein
VTAPRRTSLPKPASNGSTTCCPPAHIRQYGRPRFGLSSSNGRNASTLQRRRRISTTSCRSGLGVGRGVSALGCRSGGGTVGLWVPVSKTVREWRADPSECVETQQPFGSRLMGLAVSGYLTRTNGYRYISPFGAIRCRSARVGMSRAQPTDPAISMSSSVSNRDKPIIKPLQAHFANQQCMRMPPIPFGGQHSDTPTVNNSYHHYSAYRAPYEPSSAMPSTVRREPRQPGIANDSGQESDGSRPIT